VTDNRIPARWQETTLGEVAVSIRNGLSAKPDGQDGVPILRISAVRPMKLDLKDIRYLNDADKSEGADLRRGDVLFTRYNGNPALVGTCAVVSTDPGSTVYPDKLMRVRLREGICLPGFVAAMASVGPSRQFLESRARTTAGQTGISGGDLRQMPLWLPTLDEQHSIVEALDSYLSRLDDAIANLERVRRNLGRYRASVLQAAVEGRLVPTEAELAKAEGRTFEPATVLLQRVLAERRQRWAASAKKGKYEEPVGPDTAGLPELPAGWCWASVEQLGEVTGGLTQNAKRDAYPLQMPFLRVANVYAKRLILDDVQQIGVQPSEVERALLMTGDLLVVEGNGSVDQIGRVARWDGSVTPCLHQNHLIKVRLPVEGLERWALLWLLAPGGRKAIVSVASSTSGLHTLSISKVSRLIVPLPPLGEQARAVAEVDRLLSVVDEQELAVSKGIVRTRRLRQSILKWAFEGKLVDQDPNDEPASRSPTDVVSVGAAKSRRPRVQS